MPNTLIKKIQEAEGQAEKIKLDAVREAREIIKSVEEASAINARQAAKDIREGAQRLIEEARVGTADEIKSLEVRRSAEREAMRELAQNRVEPAAQAIFERIVQDGNR